MRRLRLLLPALLACATLAGGLSLHAQGRLYTMDQIDQMVAPIALYPDALMSQVLMAATFPDQVADADRWVRANPGLAGPDLDDALATATWDPSVIALCKFPSVLDRMADNMRWTTDLGYAFLDQRTDVMSACQTLRRASYQQGYLRTTPQQRVVYQDQVVVIEPYTPGVIYVPAYQPAVVFGPVWSYPTYYYPAVWAPSPGYSFVNGFAWGLGFAVGNVLFGGCDWHHHDVFVNNTVIMNSAIYHNTPYYERASLHPAYGRQSWTHYADRTAYARGGTGAPYEGRSYGRVHGTGPARDGERANLQHTYGPSRYDRARVPGTRAPRYPNSIEGRPSSHGPDGYRAPREGYTPPRNSATTEPRSRGPAHGPEGYRSPRENNAAPRGSSGTAPPSYGAPPAHGPARRGEGATSPRAPQNPKAPEYRRPQEGHTESHGPTGTPAPAMNRGPARGSTSPWVYGNGRSRPGGIPTFSRPANTRPAVNTPYGARSGGGYADRGNPRGAGPAHAPQGARHQRRNRL